MSFVAVCFVKKRIHKLRAFDFYQIHHLALGDCMISWDTMESSSLGASKIVRQNENVKTSSHQIMFDIETVFNVFVL